MFKGNITGLIIIVLIDFLTTVKADEHNMKVVKKNTSLVAYGMDLDGFENTLLAHVLSYEKPEISISRYPQWLPREREF